MNLPFKQMLSLRNFYDMTNSCLPWILGCTLLVLGLGVFAGFFLAPPDYQQGEAFRIIYVHVPAAFWSLGIYTFIFINSVMYLIWRIKINDIIANASAPIGAIYTFIALVTGALWGKPMWGTWWIWDARLTSELILFFLYLGYIGLRKAQGEHRLKAKMAAVLAIVGMIDVPIVHFSVQWWQTLHQGATLARLAKPAMPPSMLIPLLVMILAFGLFYVSLLLIRIRTSILVQAFSTEWVRSLLLKRSAESC